MEEKKSSDFLHKIGAALLAIVPILVLLPPIVGFSFNLGYLSVFGLDANTFPRSTIELWQYSYFVAFQWLAASAKPYAYILVFYLLLFALLFIIGVPLVILRVLGKLPLSNKKYKVLFDKKAFLGRIDTFIESCEMLYDEAKGFWYGFLIVLLVPFILFLLLAQPYMSGNEFAQKVLNSYKESGCTKNTKNGWASCVDYSSPNNPKAIPWNGLLIAASSTHIAIFDGNGINVIPRNSDYVLTRTYKGKEKEDESTR
jgi:hypothetical protein